MTVMVSVGKNGGCYVHFTRHSWRVCLWYVACTVLWSLDDAGLPAALEKVAKLREALDIAKTVFYDATELAIHYFKVRDQHVPVNLDAVAADMRRLVTARVERINELAYPEE